jgi:hypothetical protein
MASDSKPAEAKPAAPPAEQPPQDKPTAAALGEDDEFEDFPVDGAFNTRRRCS